MFVLLVGAMLVGALAWFSQGWLDQRKAQFKAGSGPKTADDTAQVFNPEKTGSSSPPRLKLGADSGVMPPSESAAATRPGAAGDDAIRPVRGPDGKIMVDAQGRAMAIDKNGHLVQVPAIEAMGGDPAGRKPLPGEAPGTRVAGTTGAGQQQQKPPSRYSGSLFVGDPVKPSNAAASASGGASSPAVTQAQLIADILRGSQGRSGSSVAAPGTSPTLAAPEAPRLGTVGATLYSSATPVAFASRMSDQNLVLPKGRQADCVLTGRIIDEVPGFTSCVLAQNLYSDNGRVLLLERGSELTGEYGVANQLGLERLFVTWNRLKTPDGITIDLSSPGADRLGTSGVPGHLDNRWGERIGAALLISVVKDVTVAIINKEMQSNSNATVNVQTTPGQNTINSSSALAEEVVKQTIKVRPRLTINEGERISIYVARDLDFTPVYALKTAGNGGATRLLSK
jgi:type IV secretion system protein VirB10